MVVKLTDNTMKIGVYQFKGSGDIKNNLNHILNGMEKAATEQVRLTVFQECALCGYPPLEVESRDSIDFQEMETALSEICQAAKKFNMYTALGMIRKDDADYYNSICLISSEGTIMGFYDKKALWGWGTENFKPGQKKGIFKIDGIKIAFRICFDIRFPECFRDCFTSGVQLCFVSFCDVQNKPSPERYDLIKAHLRTRAVENIMTVVSVNTISGYQTAPTAVIGNNGEVITEAPVNEESILVYDFLPAELSFGQKGIAENSRRFV